MGSGGAVRNQSWLWLGGMGDPGAFLGWIVTKFGCGGGGGEVQRPFGGGTVSNQIWLHWGVSRSSSGGRGRSRIWLGHGGRGGPVALPGGNRYQIWFWLLGGAWVPEGGLVVEFG